MRRERLGLMAIAGTYVGTVVGAGFATGQEVMQFFAAFGLQGVLGAVICAALFALLGAATLRIAYQVGATSHREVLNEVTGPRLGKALDWVLAGFLFTGAGIMMAGSGAVFAEHWHMNRTLGTVAMAGLSVVTVLFGLRGVVASISLVAPVLIVMVLVISGWAVWQVGIVPADLQWYAPRQSPVSWWVLSALLYVSYNLFFSISVLAPLGGRVADQAMLARGGMIGGAALGVATIAITLALLAGLPATAGFEVPMLHLAGLLPAWVKPAYSLVLWAEIYTTAVSSLYGLAVRFVSEGRAPRFRGFTITAGLGALVLGQLGFANMVAVVFPAMGWLGLIFIGGLILRSLRAQPSLLR